MRILITAILSFIYILLYLVLSISGWVVLGKFWYSRFLKPLPETTSNKIKTNGGSLVNGIKKQFKWKRCGQFRTCG